MQIENHGHDRAKRKVVYYAREDLAGLGARLAIGAIDIAVLTLAFLPFAALVEAYAPGLRHELKLLGLLSWPYLAGLKSTRFGTLGYRLMGFRLVGLDGQPPSLFRATARFLFLLFWAGIDTFWLSGDENRQAFRDKFAGTYVVRRNAEPIGVGRISYDTYFVFGAALPVSEVVRGADGTKSAVAAHEST